MSEQQLSERPDSRIYTDSDNLWYIRMRGNIQLGPYDSRVHAEAALDKQIRHWAPLRYTRRSSSGSFNPFKLLRRSVFRQT